MKELQYQKIVFLMIIFLIAANISLAGAVAAEKPLIKGDQISYNFAPDTTELRSVVAEGQVTALYRDYQIKGDRIEYYHDSSQINVSGQAFFSDQDSTITSQRMTGNLDEEKMVFTDQVTLQSKELKVTADILNYNKPDDKIVFNGKPEGEQPHLLYRDIEASANTITLIPGEEKAYLVGKASGQSKEAQFAGEELIIDLQNNQVVLRNKAEIFFKDQGANNNDH